MSFLSQLTWRRAVKSFDKQIQLTDLDLGKILEAIHMAPTSFGLQPFRVAVVRDGAIREKLKAAAWNQDQVTASGALLVFIADANVEKRIKELIDTMSGGNVEVRKSLAAYESMMSGALLSRSTDELKAWAAKQAYIALGFGLAAAAELKIDSCPMEGFSGPDFDKILGLEPGHSSCVLLAVGYRTSVPLMPSFHFPEELLFQRV